MSRPKLTVNKRLIEVGKRIQLIHAVNNKGGSELRDGDEGTIVDISRLPDSLVGNRQIWVRWERYDDGGNFTVAMIEGEDRFTVLD